LTTSHVAVAVKVAVNGYDHDHVEVHGLSSYH